LTNSVNREDVASLRSETRLVSVNGESKITAMTESGTKREDVPIETLLDYPKQFVCHKNQVTVRPNRPMSVSYVDRSVLFYYTGSREDVESVRNQVRSDDRNDKNARKRKIPGLIRVGFPQRGQRQPSGHHNMGER